MTQGGKAAGAGNKARKSSGIREQLPDEWRAQPASDPDRLLELDRLAILGLLTESLAHEILNPLSAAFNFNMLVQQMLSAKTLSPERIGAMKKHLGDAASELSRVCRLLSELRAFAQGSGARKEVLDLNRIAESALSLASHRLKLENVQVATRLSSRSPWVVGDRVQLQHLVLHVIQKCTENRKNDSLEILTEARDPVGEALLEVRHGRDRISSKRSAGSCPKYPNTHGCFHSSLPVARYIAQAHGGNIVVDRTSGGSMVYRIILPMADSRDLKSRGQK